MQQAPHPKEGCGSGLRIDECTYLSIELERHIDAGGIIDCLRIDFSNWGSSLAQEPRRKRPQSREVTVSRLNFI